MQVLLLSPVPSLGNPGELVSVRNGYARNYLVPQGLAVAASPDNVKQFAHQKRMADQRREKFLTDLKSVVDRLEGTKVGFIMKSGPQGKLFGSVTNRMIAEKLTNEIEYAVDRTMIQLENPLRETGDYVVEVKLDKAMSSRVKIHVEGEYQEPAPVAEEVASEEASEDQNQNNRTEEAGTESVEGEGDE